MSDEEGVYIGNACMQKTIGLTNFTENCIGVTYAKSKNEALGWLADIASKQKPGWPITKITVDKVDDSNVLQWAEAIKRKTK